MLPLQKRQALLRSLSETEAQELLYNWRFLARPSQILPGTALAGINRKDWVFWVAMAGRGWGKTRVGAEGVREWGYDPKARILMIAPTAADVREVMLEGPSGLLSCYPRGARPTYNPSRHLVTFPSGAVGITRSADEPERLRGPQFTKFWADELCAWNFPEEAWQQISFGFRLKTARLQGIITTTPKPIKVFKQLLKNPRTVVTRGSSYENRDNVSEQFFTDIIKPYEGTRIGRQEINAELLEDIEGALWTQALIDAARCELSDVPELVRVVVAIDPSVTSGEESSEAGIVVAGLAESGHVYVGPDLSLRGTPGEWALVALTGYINFHADRVVGEVNNGGDLVEAVLRATVASKGLNPTMLPYRSVRASRGKAVRAEPVAALYERGLVHHIGSLQKLEEQMCSWVPGTGMKSPDRMDALVWAITDLVVAPKDSYVAGISSASNLISPI